MSHIEIIQVRPEGRPGAAALDDVATYLCEFLTENGVSWTHSVNRCNAAAAARRVLIGGHLLTDFGFMRSGDIVLNTEPMMEPKFKSNTAFVAMLSSGKYRVADYSRKNLELLPAGVDSHWLQFPALRIYESSWQPRKPIWDFVFFGTLNETRKEKISRLRAAGHTVQVLSGVFGPERDAAIRDARYTLNLHYFPSGIFESVRCVASLRLGTPVLSEWVDQPYCPEPFKNSVEFVRAGEIASSSFDFRRGVSNFDIYLKTANTPISDEQLQFFIH